MRVLHVYSGGLDSTVLLYKLLAEPEIKEIKCIHFKYGSKHSANEEKCAWFHCVETRTLMSVVKVDFTEFLPDNLALFKNNVLIPEGHYTEDNMKKTIVPFRNGILLSIAASVAESREFNAVSYAAHSGDHTIYPDCRPEFIRGMSSAIHNGTENNIILLAPFLDSLKSEIVEIGKIFNVPMEKTWTCYKGEDLHCGICGACNERKMAFKISGVLDLTIYKG